jgi:hypothetical protein
VPDWWRRNRQEQSPDARNRQVRAQSLAILQKLRAEGQPETLLRRLEPFVELAPEVLALGPVPASLTMRVLFGLCTFEGETRQRFLAGLADDLTSPSPTLRAVRRSGLLDWQPGTEPAVTERGRLLFERLRQVSDFERARD